MMLTAKWDADRASIVNVRQSHLVASRRDHDAEPVVSRRSIIQQPVDIQVFPLTFPPVHLTLPGRPNFFTGRGMDRKLNHRMLDWGTLVLQLGPGYDAAPIIRHQCTGHSGVGNDDPDV